MTYADYAALPGLNFSRLKAILTSPAHYLAALAEERKDTPAMMLGRVVHAYVLEPDTEHDAMVWDGPSRASRAGRTAWADWLTERGMDPETPATDVPTLTPADIDTARSCRDAVWRHRDAAAVLTGARTEVTLQRDRLKGRADILRDDSVWDLKTARDLATRRFLSECVSRHYYEQLAFYRLLADVPEAGIIGVETTAPYDVLVMQVGAVTLEHARQRITEALDTLRACEALDVWPGRYPARVELEAPAYYLPDPTIDDFTFTEDE
ncbi:MAG TPA: PD-(D/E)XK nuclease-like domain-containing protein [Vicinamibacterales bacterium]|nr:PD-(D/E)XK nuclease-like domain-containing protein [Vicinamibacterales bacterium]